MIRALLFWTTAAVAGILVVATLLPLIPTEWWAARLLAFPRLYWTAGLVLAGLAILPHLRWAPRAGAALLAANFAALVVNAAILWPYLPVAALPGRACPTPRRLAVMIANVQLGNRNAAPLLDAIRRVEPDLFLAMETDHWWEEALKPVGEAMPNTLRRITGSYYGMEFFSRLPLVNSEIRHLARGDTPAVITGVIMRTGETIDFVGMHPRPPLVLQSALDRDSQLYAAAAVLRERVEPGILAGDLNATPWEAAVERMRRVSGLIDPRQGYGYVATWNAKIPWARWPLDHILHEGGFTTQSVERLEAFGSDHFPYLVRLCRIEGGQKLRTPAPDASDVAAANAVLSAAGATERLREQ